MTKAEIVEIVGQAAFAAACARLRLEASDPALDRADARVWLECLVGQDQGPSADQEPRPRA